MRVARGRAHDPAHAETTAWLRANRNRILGAAVEEALAVVRASGRPARTCLPGGGALSMDFHATRVSLWVRDGVVTSVEAG